MTLGDYIALGVIDITVIAGLSVIIGATAPRWPDRWFAHDSSITRPLGLETPQLYRRLGAGRLAARLPEFGQVFGGRSKRSIPGRDLAAVEGYLVEVRRAIWVHYFSMLTWLPLAFFNPWWMTLAGAVIAVGVNVPFLVILRGNNLRLSRMVASLREKDRREQEKP
jgi:glycosyl-4,4'-diaponeurosporenoate acyltransferase